MKISLVLGLGIVVAGCEPVWKCSDYCGEGNKCTGATQIDCTSFCQSAETLNNESHCTIEWDSYLECEQNHPTAVCDGGSCDSEMQGWVGCVTVYCLQHTDAAECAIQ